MATAEFRFHAELNDFIARPFRQRTFVHGYARDATVKHAVEALGVPHTEIELILANGMPADFSRRIQDGDRISVYPHFQRLDISSITCLPARPVSGEKFIADAHLGQLARDLRMLGFDVLYRNSYSDAEVARISADEARIVLTRDRDLLIRKDVILGCYLHSIVCGEQICEVLMRFNLAHAVRAFSRCLTCNGLLRPIDKQAVMHRLPDASGKYYDQFHECMACGHVYWEGSHVNRMRDRIAHILDECRASLQEE